MQKLIQGLHQFHDRVVGANSDFFASLAKGQHPSTLFITCSDSRINPNLITQTGPGELFTLRNAGNLVPPYRENIDSGAAASIEYALYVLKVEHVVVCGHSHCGAMSAVAHDTPLHELPALQRWLGHAQPVREILCSSYKELKGNERVAAAVQENVLVQMEHLRTHPAVADALARNAVQIEGWVYEIESGEVFTYDATTGQFVPTFGDRPKVERPSSARQIA